ncbi:hypothetical protein [Dactylosporangium sp. NPDC050588]|uniref:hypothetical protein n=1 Tax=Dactylosporangium sp. NPDC050588 TaxID=3157211 RepID=UPI003401A545
MRARILKTCGASRKAATGGHDASARITFGPQYVAAIASQQTYTFLHESSHAALHTKDVSYTVRRRFFLLDGRDALRDADSIALFVMLAMDPDFTARKFAPQDGYTGLSLPQIDVARRTMADVETWLGLAAHHVDHLYRRSGSACSTGPPPPSTRTSAARSPGRSRACCRTPSPDPTTSS